jgi:uncharacterized protein with PQ loop repeat
MSSQSTIESVTKPNTKENKAQSDSFRRLVMVELYTLLIELISGVYMFISGVSIIPVVVHSVFGVVAGVIGVLLVFRSLKLSKNTRNFCVIGFLFVVIAGIAGALFVASGYTVDAYSYLMAASFVISGAFYSFTLSAR